jgi:hypothetical protein
MYNFYLLVCPKAGGENAMILSNSKFKKKDMRVRKKKGT